MGALAFGHLPTIFVPGGPMPSGIPNKEKARIRQLFAEGKVGRDALLESEAQSYHSPGTCTFYGTANSNQVLMEVMGLHLPGAAFVPPEHAAARCADQRRRAARRAHHCARRRISAARAASSTNARSSMRSSALLATGGSTNHTLHLVAMARAAGIAINWDDFSELSDIVPLLARIYPNGGADVNHFHAAGGMGFLIRELLGSGLLHADTTTVMGAGPGCLHAGAVAVGRRCSRGAPAPEASGDRDVLRPMQRSVRRRRRPEGPARQSRPRRHQDVGRPAAASRRRSARRACSTIRRRSSRRSRPARWRAIASSSCAIQGPRANGMPELHQLTPTLSSLQSKGHKVALVTDGRMSGASGAVPAAIHVTPECLAGGPLGKVQDGDIVRLDSYAGMLEVRVPEATLRAAPRRRPISSATSTASAASCSRRSARRQRCRNAVRSRCSVVG